jgi:hypothetical protein
LNRAERRAVKRKPAPLARVSRTGFVLPEERDKMIGQVYGALTALQFGGFTLENSATMGAAILVCAHLVGETADANGSARQRQLSASYELCKEASLKLRAIQERFLKTKKWGANATELGILNTFVAIYDDQLGRAAIPRLMRAVEWAERHRWEGRHLTHMHDPAITAKQLEEA